MVVFFGFALASSMFSGDCTISRKVMSIEATRAIVGAGVVSCLNPSHVATISAMTARYGLEVAVPERPPSVLLAEGDSALVMGVRGLPRLTDRHEYTSEEVAKATFEFVLYSVS